MALTACFVCLVSFFSGRPKTTFGGASDCSRHITKLEQSTFLRYLWLTHLTYEVTANAAYSLWWLVFVYISADCLACLEG